MEIRKLTDLLAEKPSYYVVKITKNDDTHTFNNVYIINSKNSGIMIDWKNNDKESSFLNDVPSSYSQSTNAEYDGYNIIIKWKDNCSMSIVKH
ncbi:hypothetical protein [Apilactobacillus xinyiensis]|uniref:hypothetical protein n=1 Tax=Apilactobacillus xinyiensis TaxID=2841032 RepID=UPI00200DADD6|nr:hypothetical protein [Apilactobacillus xinyiensis]MCL0330604.1 hypothetical protein [Apilactobacillus xinyiensis]